MSRKFPVSTVLAWLVAWPALAGGATASPAENVIDRLNDPHLAELAREVLRSHPGLRAREARARAAAHRAPQVAALPDPVVNVTAFVEEPETRTGPQRLMLGLSQPLPWLGKLDLRRRAEVLATTASEAELEAQKLAVLTDTRRLFHELALVGRLEAITSGLRDHLTQHEEVARARYASGIGHSQSVVKIHAEITRRDAELLALQSRRATLAAQLNRLRAQPASTPLPPARPAVPVEAPVDGLDLLGAALRARPELRAAEARIARAEVLTALARKGYRPDFVAGLTYTIVDPRKDPAGRAMPPDGNGNDVLGLQAGIVLPVRRGKLAAAVAEAQALEEAAAEEHRDAVTGIEATLGELSQRLPLDWQQVRLLDDLLVVQAQEALDSAAAGYAAGALTALDLLDAEHVLFQVQSAAARAQADYAIAVARLEGAVGASLQTIRDAEETHP